MAKSNESSIVKYFHNDYGHADLPIISSVVEGPHGYSNIIGPNEVPSGLEKMSSLPSVSVTRKSQKG
jgi:hypothetical protein